MFVQSGPKKSSKKYLLVREPNVRQVQKKKKKEKANRTSAHPSCIHYYLADILR